MRSISLRFMYRVANVSRSLLSLPSANPIAIWLHAAVEIPPEVTLQMEFSVRVPPFYIWHFGFGFLLLFLEFVKVNRERKKTSENG